MREHSTRHSHNRGDDEALPHCPGDAKALPHCRGDAEALPHCLGDTWLSCDRGDWLSHCGVSGHSSSSTELDHICSTVYCGQLGAARGGRRGAVQDKRHGQHNLLQEVAQRTLQQKVPLLGGYPPRFGFSPPFPFPLQLPSLLPSARESRSVASVFLILRMAGFARHLLSQIRHFCPTFTKPNPPAAEPSMCVPS